MAIIDITPPATPAKISTTFGGVSDGGVFEYGGVAFVKKTGPNMFVPGTGDQTLPSGSPNAMRADGKFYQFVDSQAVTAWPAGFDLRIKALGE